MNIFKMKKLIIKNNIDTKKNIKENVIDLKYINNRINDEICYNTIDKLKDSYLLNEYKECKSVC